MSAAAINVGTWERIASVLGGGALLARGIAHSSPLNTLLAAGGAVLMQRGLTGHCAAYAALGVDRHEAPHRHRPGQWLRDRIEEASDHSFPASDPPSWTPTAAGYHAKQH